MAWRAPAQGTNGSVPASAPAVAKSAPPRDTLKQLEDELSKALRGLAPKKSIESPLPPVYQAPVVVVPSQRTRDEQDRRRNWVFDEFKDNDKPDTEGKTATATAGDDWFKSRDDSKRGQPKKKTALDEFYDRLNQERSGALLPRMSSTDSRLPGLNRSDDPANRDSDLPSGIKESAQRLRELLGTDKRDSAAAAAAAQGNPLSEFFRSGDRGFSDADLRAHKAYLSEYKKILDGPTPQGLDPLKPLGGAAAPVPSYSGNLGSLGTLGGASRISTPGSVTTVATPRHFEDPSATVLNQWNPLFTPPHFEPPKPAPLSVPQVEVPHRRF